MANASVGLAGALRPVAALLVGTGLLYLGYGLQSTLVPLRADAEGFPRLAIGLLGSTYYAGFVAGCLVAPYLILRAGHIRAFAAMVSCVSAAALAFPLTVGTLQWILFRFAFGFCISGLLVIIESWLNEKATNDTRGRVMSTYIIITYIAITVGQLGVATRPLDGFGLFSFCSIALSLAAVPVALTRASQPAAIPVVRFRPMILFSLAPAAFAGAFVSGFINGSLYSLATVYAVDSGFTANEAALFLAAFVLGGAIGQFPLGRVSDFIDRRLVLAVAAALTAAISGLLALSDALPKEALLGLALCAGLVMFPVYALAAAHAYDWTSPQDMVETSAALILLFGLGSTIGPVVASVAMEAVGAGALFVVITAAAGALVAFIVVRLRLRGRPAEEMRGDFDIYSTAPVGGALTPEPIPEDDPTLETPYFFTPPEPNSDDEQPGDTLHPRDDAEEGETPTDDAPLPSADARGNIRETV